MSKTISFKPQGGALGKICLQVPNTNATDLDFSRTGVGNYRNSAGMLQSAPTNIPRYEFGAGATCPHLLLEPQSTNLITYPLTFSNAYWTKSGATVTGDFASPHVDYPTGAFKLVESASASAIQHFKVSSSLGNGVVGLSYSNSIVAKKGENNIMQLAFGSGSFATTSYANFDLNLGTVLIASNSTAKIIPLTDGFYICSITALCNGTGAISSITSLIDSDLATRLQSYTGDGTSGVYIFGAQLEQQASATSLMLPAVENGSTTTRYADVASKTGLGSYINSVEGTIVVEMRGLFNTLSSFGAISIGTLTNGIRFGFQTGTNLLYMESVGTAVGIGKFNIPVVSEDLNKIVLTYKNNEAILYLNGIPASTDTTFTAFPPNAFSRLGLDSGSGTQNLYAKVSLLKHFNTALTPTEVANL